MNTIFYISIIKYIINIRPKERRKEPTCLKEYSITDITAAGSDELNKNGLEIESYWKLNAFFVVVNTITSSTKFNIFTESKQIATLADSLSQFYFNGSAHLIDCY